MKFPITMSFLVNTTIRCAHDVPLEFSTSLNKVL